MSSTLKILALSTVAAIGFVPFAHAADLEPLAPITEAPAPVIAAENNFYAKLYGGAAFANDNDFVGTSVAGAPFFVNLDYETGFQVGGSLGYRYAALGGPFTPRAELDVNYTRLGVGAGSTFNGGPQAFGGNQSLLFVGVNGLIDYDLTGNGKILPYVGGGVGAAILDSDVNYVNALGTVAAAFTGTSVGVGVQAIAGVEYAFTDTVSLNVEGRYIRGFGHDADRSTAAGFFGNAESDFDAFTVNGGVSFKF